MSIRLLSGVVIDGVDKGVDGTELTLSKSLEADLVAQGKAEYVGYPLLKTYLTEHHAAHAEMGLGAGQVGASWSDTVWLYAWKGSNPAAVQYGERQVFVPISDAGYYFGAFFGDKLLANSVVSLTDTCIARLGTSTKNTGLSYSSGWTASTNAAAFDTDYSYANTAGKTASLSVTGTAAAVRFFLAINGGYAVVGIDGDYTRANHLPSFTPDHYAAGLCRQTDVGKRFFSCYATSSYSECQCLADDLAPGAHLITVETTGTKPAASSDARVYIEAMLGCNGETAGSSNVHFVPIWWINHNVFDWSAQNYVIRWAPSGSTDYQFLGENHADNTNSREVTTSLSVYLDTTDQTALAAGSYASGSLLRMSHVSTLRHKADLATAVATKTRVYTAAPHRKLPLMCETKISWTAAGGVTAVEYPVMLMCSERNPGSIAQRNVNFTAAILGGNPCDLKTHFDDIIYYKPTSQRKLIAQGNKIKAFAEVVSAAPDHSDLNASYGAAYQNRSYFDDKLYVISADGPSLLYGNGDVQSFVVGWGGALV